MVTAIRPASNAGDGKLHRFGEGIQLHGKVAHAKGNVVGRSLLAPGIEKLMQRSLQLHAAVWIANVQDVAGNYLSDGVDQLEGVAGIESFPLRGGTCDAPRGPSARLVDPGPTGAARKKW